MGIDHSNPYIVNSFQTFLLSCIPSINSSTKTLLGTGDKNKRKHSVRPKSYWCLPVASHIFILHSSWLWCFGIRPGCCPLAPHEWWNRKTDWLCIENINQYRTQLFSTGERGLSSHFWYQTFPWLLVRTILPTYNRSQAPVGFIERELISLSSGVSNDKEMVSFSV